MFRISVFRALIVLFCILPGQGGVSRPFPASVSGGTWIQPNHAAINTPGASSTPGQRAFLASESPLILSDKEQTLEKMTDRFLDAIFQIDGLSWFGIAIV